MVWVMRIFGALAALVALVLGLLWMIPAERIAGMATDKFQELTGRELRIEGGVSPSFWPVLGVTAQKVSIENSAWSSSDAPMFTAESLTIAINARALIGGDVEIYGITATAPQILLERDKTGRENWVFGHQFAQTPAQSAAPAAPQEGSVTSETLGVGQSYTLEKGLITGGSIRYLDHVSGQDFRLDDLDLEIAIPDFTGPFSLHARGLSFGHEVALSLKPGAFAAFTEGRVVPLDARISVGGAHIAFEGRGGWGPLGVEGQVSADLSDPAGVAAILGLELPKLPMGLGRDRLTLGGQLNVDAQGAAYLRGALITADGNQLAGDLDFTPASGSAQPRPKLAANFRSDHLNLSGLMAESGGAASSQPAAQASSGWSKAPLDASAMGAVDAEISFVAKGLDLGMVKTQTLRVTLALDRARAVFDIQELEAYGGKVTGEFVVNGRGGLSVGGELSASHLKSGPLLKDLAGWDRLESSGSFGVNVIASGNSVHDLMHSLKGDGQLSLGQGVLKGIDIGGILRSLDTSYVGDGQSTIFDGVGGSFTLLGGELTNSDLLIEAPYLSAKGQGWIGLGARNLDYRIRPVAFADDQGKGGLMVPLRVTGSWDDPTYRLDLEGVAKEKMEAEARAAEQRLKDEVKAAEARAKEKLTEKLKSELGVQPSEGESLEDATKKRVNEALEKEAGKLLQGLILPN